eukprot:704979-Hanusia_phi.AAC.1
MDVYRTDSLVHLQCTRTSFQATHQVRESKTPGKHTKRSIAHVRNTKEARTMPFPADMEGANSAWYGSAIT